MKKLDEIPKKNIFNVPDGYFEDLPGRIQARIPASRETSPSGFFSLRYALPALLIVGIAITSVFLTRPSASKNESPEAMLETIATDDLVAYLENSSEMNLDELLESYPFSDDDLNSIEDEVYGLPLEEENLEELMEEYEFDLDEW